MLADHPALAMSQGFEAARGTDPYLGLSLLASDYVANRVQIDPHARGIFCHDLLHRDLDREHIEELAGGLLPADTLRLVELGQLDAARALAGGNLRLPSEDEVMRGLRQLRHAVMLRIIGRMACGIAACRTTLGEISAFADWAIGFAARFCERRLIARHGLPVGRDGELMEMLVIGMGKLGGDELNLSSDIDLIFVQPELGETRALYLLDDSQSEALPETEVQSLDAGRFFTRVGRQMIALLDKVTSDGFVFRTDMRLRPYGDSGALISRMAELESYYYEQARNWERFALCRARVLTGSPERVAELESMIEGFVYRRHVDFDVINHLREQGSSLAVITQRQQAQDNIKLGEGGIREIEFHAQALQLVYGGVYPQLRERNTLQVLEQAAEVGLMSIELSEQLCNHYLWLRDLENRLQALSDEQTQRLPKDEDKLKRIAAGLGFAQVEEFQRQLEMVRGEVHRAYSALLSRGQESLENQPRIEEEWHKLNSELMAGNNAPLLERVKSQTGLDALDALCNKLDDFSARMQPLDEQVHNHLRQILPTLLRSCFATAEPTVTLTQVFELLIGILRRPTYLSLLRENQGVIPALVLTMTTSRWCARQVIERPMLLSCFLESRAAWQKPDRTDLLRKLQLQLFSLPDNDLEQEMDALRHFALARRMQVALAQLNESLSLMQVSDYLSYTAEACIEAACRMAWRQLVERHGAPGEDDLSGVAVLAYGKLGGLELSYASDLDLVFLFDQPADPQGAALTNGPKPITGMQFYQRLAQRVIHLLSAPTSAGFAYAIDTRLRPDGEGGLLASSLDYWKRYYQTKAWTWEMQALVRARPICGSPRALTACVEARRELLAHERDLALLKSEVLAMRGRIAETHGNKGLKYMRGGLVDIEFMVQYLALAHAAQHPEVVRYPDNVRIIQSLAKQELLDADTARVLRGAYLEVRNLHHADYLEIQQQAIDLPDLRPATQLWDHLFANVEVPTEKTDAKTNVKANGLGDKQGRAAGL